MGCAAAKMSQFQKKATRCGGTTPKSDVSDFGINDFKHG